MYRRIKSNNLFRRHREMLEDASTRNDLLDPPPLLDLEDSWQWSGREERSKEVVGLQQEGTERSGSQADEERLRLHWVRDTQPLLEKRLVEKWVGRGVGSNQQDPTNFIIHNTHEDKRPWAAGCPVYLEYTVHLDEARHEPVHLAPGQLGSGQVLPVMHLQVAAGVVLLGENLVYLECGVCNVQCVVYIVHCAV